MVVFIKARVLVQMGVTCSYKFQLTNSESLFMKILIVNPNTSDLVLKYMMVSAKRGALPDTQLIGMRSPGGTSSIDSSYGDYMSAPHMIEAVRRKVAKENPDAVVLCGFGNVGIFALKEILDIPVVSISESTMALACILGHKFTSITVLPQFIPYQEDIVRLFGFESKCASVRSININVEDAARDRERTLAELKVAVEKIVEEDRAEVIILGCGGLCGFDRELTEISGVPILDPVIVGVKTAESLVQMGLCHSKIRKFHVPPQPIEDYHGELLAREVD